MPDKFACEIIFQLSSTPGKDRYTVFGGKLCSTVIDLEEQGADIYRDVFLPYVPEVIDEAEPATALKDGVYKVFFYGDVWQDNTQENDWVFTPMEIRYIPLATADMPALRGKYGNNLR